MATESKARTRRWAALRRELASRLFEPFEHPTFVFYFFGIVFGVGGVGAWVELFKILQQQETTSPLDGLLTSLITFCFALVGTSCTQLIIEESQSKALRALAQLVLFLAFFGGALAIAGVGSGQTAAIWAWALASIAALVVWWIANATSKGLKDPDVPTGGDVKKTLPGDLSDYKIK